MTKQNRVYYNSVIAWLKNQKLRIKILENSIDYEVREMRLRKELIAAQTKQLQHEREALQQEEKVVKAFLKRVK